MKTEITTLANKLKIVTTAMPGARSVTAAFMVGAGGRHEDFEVNGGVSHFLEHILFKGTARWPTAKQISEEIDAVGGINNAYTASDLTSFDVKVPQAHLAMALEILVDMMTAPLFEEAEIDRERGVIIEEINWRRHDDPTQFVQELLPPLLWPHDGLKNDVAGKEEVIRTISRRAIMAYKERYYKPSNMVLSVAGAVEHQRVVEQIERLMGHLPAGRVPKLAPVKTRLAGERVASFAKSTAQSHFLIGCRAYPYWHPRDAASKVISAILGGGMSSRLFVNVRETKGLAYSVSTSIGNFVDTGVFEVYAGANAEKADEAVAAVLEELERIRIEPVSPEELDKAKSKIRGGTQMASESNGSLADRFGTQLLLLGRVRGIEETLDAIDAVTAADVAATAADMLAPSKLRLAIIAADGSSAKLKFEELTRK